MNLYFFGIDCPLLSLEARRGPIRLVSHAGLFPCGFEQFCSAESSLVLNKYTRVIGGDHFICWSLFECYGRSMDSVDNSLESYIIGSKREYLLRVWVNLFFLIIEHVGQIYLVWRRWGCYYSIHTVRIVDLLNWINGPNFPMVVLLVLEVRPGFDMSFFRAWCPTLDADCRTSKSFFNWICDSLARNT